MKSIKVSSLLLLGFMICYACGPGTYSAEEYTKYVKDEKNGLHKKRTIGDLTIDLQFKPVDLLVLEEISKSNDSKKSIELRKEELAGLQYFDLRLKDENGSIIEKGATTNEDQQNRLYYFSFGMQNDLYLVEGVDTLKCILYHFERTYDLKQARNFVLGFEKSTSTTLQDKELVLDSKELGFGIIKIGINKSDLEALPSVNYN